jgi:hypothetical protein
MSSADLGPFLLSLLARACLVTLALALIEFAGAALLGA